MRHRHEYDDDTYAPRITAPEGGWTHEDSHALGNKALEENIEFARTRRGKVHMIRAPFNPKSIPLCDGAPHGGKQRLKFEELESLGTCQLKDTPSSGEVIGAPAEPAAPAHVDRDHALLSASGANRWLNCTPSALLEDQYPDSSSDAAAEGTAAHELAEHKLRTLQGLPTTEPTSHWHNEDMETHCDDYADHITAELARTQEASPAAFLAIEQRLDFSHIVPDGFGTGDALIVGDNTMTIVDLKYGKGVEVSAENNPQMRLYALGALRQFGMIYDIHTVRMVIFQPRLNNISVEEIPITELTEWADSVVRPRATMAMAGEGELTTGSWCQFCRHAPNCPALARTFFDVVPTSAPLTPAAPEPDTLTDDQVATIVTHAGELKKWLTKVEAHALEQANTGRTYPGLKLVEGRSVRRYADDDAVAQAVEATGHDPYEKKLLGITAMTKLLGKKTFDETLAGLLVKPEGKPTLVPEDDKRPALEVSTPDTVFTQIA